MNKTIFAFTLLICSSLISTAQKNAKEVELNNYSTSYAARKITDPFVLTAIPYSGKYEVADKNTPLDMQVTTSAYRYRALTDTYRKLYTYDSAEVYFYAPNVFATNAAQYEFRVLKNGKEVVTPWSGINSFTTGDLQLQSFKKDFAQLGGYKTTWDNYLTVELRKKGSEKLLSAASVYWKQVKPALLDIYTSNELNEFLARLKRSWDLNLSEGEIEKWKKQYPKGEIDSESNLPKKLVLPSSENSVIFYLKANIYKKDALEYQVEQDGKILTDWRPNDFDNNIIWLKNLTPGSFIMRMRYSAQRHNVAEYPFEIKPAWHQTTFFKIIAGSLIAAFFGFIILLFRLSKQKRKMAEEQSKKAKLGLELKAIHAQLNPHFVFNALNSIQGLINNNNIAGANRYLSTFGNLMRDSLTGSDKDKISLDKEINMLKTYLTLEQLRFGFKYVIDIDKAINTSETEIPSLLLQPLVENAVKHGVAALEEKGLIKINFVKENNDMAVRINDNGNGFATSQPSAGYGLKLTKDRVQLLNEVLKGQAITFAISSGNGQGTIVSLLFKNWWL